MPVIVSAIANCDDAVLFWKIEQPISNCWGFAIERELRLANGEVQSSFLDNRIGFAADAAQPGDTRPSTEWPFQRFSWTDHSVNERDVVRYRVVPVVHSGVALVQLTSKRSQWTPWLELSARASGAFSAFFNRGLVISQFMSRYLEQLRVAEGLATLKDAAARFKKNLVEHEEPIREFLSGALRLEMLALLEGVKKNKGHVFAALYELDDAELIEHLGKLGTHGHVVLANGSISQKKGEPITLARKRDQNKAARAALTKKKLEISDRMISPKPLGHNKFLVVTDAKKKPTAVWTGSTNWSTTGLCTQINNGLLVKNAAFARSYMEQWQRLKDAESAFPDTLLDENSTPNRHAADRLRLCGAALGNRPLAPAIPRAGRGKFRDSTPPSVGALARNAGLYGHAAGAALSRRQRRHALGVPRIRQQGGTAELELELGWHYTADQHFPERA